MLDGRVKTLILKIHANSSMNKIKNIKECLNKIFRIDLIVVNFILSENCLSSKNPNQIVENIDIEANNGKSRTKTQDVTLLLTKMIMNLIEELENLKALKFRYHVSI